MTQSLIWAALGTGFAFLMTVSGAATVFLFRKQVNEGLQKIFLGFASGIMIAASVWSLIIPAIDQAKASGILPWLPAAMGFFVGGIFLLTIDGVFQKYTKQSNRTNLLIFAVTLHNIPEGMAVGLAFALAAQNMDQAELYASAFALALGIGVQNFPEGAAVSLPLRQEGMSTLRAFLYGVLSAVVEPIAGMLVVLVSGVIRPVMPWLLSFAAGAMIYVVVEELIPEANDGGSSHRGTIGSMAGFLIMMILDVALSL
jgi:ZIP family zinc transporter